MNDEITANELLEFGEKLKINQTIYNELPDILNWSKTLSPEQIKESIEFLEEKIEERFQIVMEDPFEGREIYEKENILKAAEMKKVALSLNDEKNLDWFKGSIWLAHLVANSVPLSSDISQLLKEWIELNRN